MFIRWLADQFAHKYGTPQQQPGAAPQQGAPAQFTASAPKKRLPPFAAWTAVALVAFIGLVAWSGMHPPKAAEVAVAPMATVSNPDQAAVGRIMAEFGKNDGAAMRQAMPAMGASAETGAQQQYNQQIQPPAAPPAATPEQTAAEQERERLRKSRFASPVLPIPELVASAVIPARREPVAPSVAPGKDEDAKEPAGAPAASAKASPMDCLDTESLFAICEGSYIQAITDNRMIGEFVGPANATVVQDVMSRDRQHLLIPKGTLALGRAAKVDQAYQQRLSLAFHRMILPDGRGIELKDVAGLSRNGEMAIKDKVNRHLLSTYGSAVVMGGLAGFTQFGFGGTGTALNGNGLDMYRQSVSGQVGQVGQQQLARGQNRPNDLTVREGTPVILYVNADLHLPEYMPSISTGFVKEESKK